MIDPNKLPMFPHGKNGKPTEEELNVLIEFFESQALLDQDFQDALDELTTKVNKPKKERFIDG